MWSLWISSRHWTLSIRIMYRRPFLHTTQWRDTNAFISCSTEAFQIKFACKRDETLITNKYIVRLVWCAKNTVYCNFWSKENTYNQIGFTGAVRLATATKKNSLTEKKDAFICGCLRIIRVEFCFTVSFFIGLFCGFCQRILTNFFLFIRNLNFAFATT